MACTETTSAIVRFARRKASSAAESSSLSKQVSRLCSGRCGAGCIHVTLMDPLCCKQLSAGAANRMEPWDRAKTFRSGHKPKEGWRVAVGRLFVPPASLLDACLHFHGSYPGEHTSPWWRASLFTKQTHSECFTMCWMGANNLSIFINN